jgi:predicted kinase
MPWRASVHTTPIQERARIAARRDADKVGAGRFDDAFTSDRRWRRLRKMYITAHPLCSECLKRGRTVPASEVDHRIPRRDRPDLAFEWDNLDGLCKTHHSIKTRWEKAGHMVPVTIVCGPPGSGKSTYVREHMKQGDLVVDLDAIGAALSMTPMHHSTTAMLDFSIPARDAVLKRLEAPARVGAAWVIAGLPDRAERDALSKRLRASLVLLDVPADECVRRLIADKERPATEWEPRVEQWWKAYRETTRI